MWSVGEHYCKSITPDDLKPIERCIENRKWEQSVLLPLLVCFYTGMNLNL